MPAATIMRNPADPPKESWKVGGWEESGWGPNSAGFYQPRLNRSHCPGDSGTSFAKKLYFRFDTSTFNDIYTEDLDDTSIKKIKIRKVAVQL